MGHHVSKAVYQQLGKKIDGLTIRTPWNENLYAVLKELYTPEEAQLIARMPYRPSGLDRICQITGYDASRVKPLLESLCEKGLVMDLLMHDACYYMASPLVIGIFEFTMMRTGGNLNTKAWAKLFHAYMFGDDSFLEANCTRDKRVSIMRALPHEGTVTETDYVEVLDYEKATAIVEQNKTFSLGICSCRHEKFHLGEKTCDVPLETCAAFGEAAKFLVRNKLAREVSQSQMFENLARSREMGLVLSADNVKQQVGAICSCCPCCCNILQGIGKYGYPGILVTSNFIAHIDEMTCIGCGLCARACPIDAIAMIPDDEPQTRRKQRPRIDTSVCVGCGVCSLKCTKTGSLKLVKRQTRVLHPETTMERIILQCLERGTLQNQLFDDPNKLSHDLLRLIVGAFLRLPPVKKSLMSDLLRSRFLSGLKAHG
ncbi:MAG: 4Fe-4S binding protein [Phycisphaerae bacterium]|nr:4Fe-4S binding protein [Phycisphaerae bacterium]